MPTHTYSWVSSVVLILSDIACLMVFNATFNNISVISWRSFYWWRKPENPEKTTDLSKDTDKLYHNVVHLTRSRFELPTSVVICPDCILHR